MAFMGASLIIPLLKLTNWVSGQNAKASRKDKVEEGGKSRFSVDKQAIPVLLCECKRKILTN
jgi:hypothetical protein